MDYHAHIYWDTAEQRARALDLRNQLAVLGCGLGRIADEPIGPHPLPMYQATYSTSNAREVESLLSGADLTVLLHEDTGNDVRDHTVGARWLGETLELDLVWLEEYSRRKQ